MTTYNTSNPIGSTDARDRLDNSENMDILENSTTLNAHADRLGTMRKTRKGMELEHDNQIAAHEAEHDAQIAAHELEHDNQMQSFENEFDSRLAGMAFNRVGKFTAGATLTDMRQTLLWEVSQGGDGHEYGWTGSFPKVVPAGATPATSGGVGAGAWVDRTQDTLRSELQINDLSIDDISKLKKDCLDQIVKSNPSLDSSMIGDKTPVFILNSSADFSTMYALFSTKTKTKCVLQEINNTRVSVSDGSNIGGQSNTRMTASFVVKDSIVGQLNPFSSSNTTSTTAISEANWKVAVGFPPTYAGYGFYKNSTYGLDQYKTWLVANTGTIEFYANSDSKILFYKSGASSSSVNIYTDSNLSGTYNTIPETISLVGSGGYRHTIQANTKVKIENLGSGACYVIGVDVSSIYDASYLKKYDSVCYFREDDYNGSTAYFLGPATGSNDIALRAAGGKFFGSYHGGHSSESVSVSVDGVTSISGINKFSYGISAKIKSTSSLSDDDATYTCNATISILSGVTRSYIEIIPTYSKSEIMSETFLAMTIANSRFNLAVVPECLLINGVVGDEFELSRSQSVVQVDKTRGHQIRTDFLLYDNVNASKNGPYILQRATDNKLYYNPSEGGLTYFNRLVSEIYRYFTS